MTKSEIPQMQLVEANEKGSVGEMLSSLSESEKDQMRNILTKMSRREEKDALTSVRQKIMEEPSVAMMLQKVIDGGITNENVAALESLVGLYDRMQAKNAEREFNQAFAKLQSELSSVSATRTVPDKQGNLKYKFAPYEDIMETVKPVLIANGFAISFTTRFMEGRMVSICTLRHVGGFSQSNEFAVRIGGGPPGSTETQADGAAKTYAKRGALCDALNIVVEHSDDDGRLLGSSIGKALAEDLEQRVNACGADRTAFLKYAGASDFESIPDLRYDDLDELLKRKEAAKAAREKLSPEGTWK